MDNSNKCSVCSKKFTQKKNLYVHLRKIHKIEPLLGLKPTKKFSCNMCDTKFSCQSSQTRHFRTIHKIKFEHDYTSTGAARKVRLICPKDSCNKEVLFYDSLRQHLTEEHGIEVECESLTFSSMKEFEIWKDEIQQRTFSSYTKDSGCKLLKSGVNRIFFNCHRSYSYTSKGNNIRFTKSMGTNKIGKACPSRLEVIINEKTIGNNEPVVSVKYWKTHCGHTSEIGRISLNKDIRSKIADKLKEGVTFDHVLDSIRHSEWDNNSCPRLQLLNRKDIHNIVRDFNINNATKFHNNDDNIVDKEKLNNEKMYKCNRDCDLKNNRNLINKTELLLGLVNTVEISDEDVISVEKQIDRVIEMLNKFKKNVKSSKTTVSRTGKR